ncbi:hypothetical protein Cgig2_024829 [Carnegiea gigantea]|uniref:non-specific serine/threonine protein kinase n=1 Tax=Carnegiea gigantea TaxID=171969 RepID=A0A9Q1KEG3_9CARY|nr:hypothetical protein Cgig2_024829 [Carnegiea gigantea]
MGNCVGSSASAQVESFTSNPSSAYAEKLICFFILLASGASKGPSVSSTSQSSNLSSLNSTSSTAKSSAQSLPTPRSEHEILSSPGLNAFTFNELKTATKNFRADNLIGEGGFGCVYKGWIDKETLSAAKPGSGMVVAVKKLKPEGFQGHKEWLTEVNYLGQLHHPNLVKLIGYCLDGENRLLVYELLPKGSLENHLFRRGPQPLPWATRIKVAIGAARGLSFLHDAESQVIYRDFKASNILLDADFNAKLSDFGLAKAGPTGDRTHVSTQVIGTQGYAAPEYVATGRLSAKSDVYSYGVVLLELLTGRRALDKSRVSAEQSLADWAKPSLDDKRKLLRIMDTKLEGQYPQKAAFTVATLALQCLNPEPRSRPKVSEVLQELEKLQDLKSSAKNSHKGHKDIPNPIKPPRRHHHSPMNLTPSASPLSSHRQSPLKRR